MNCKFCGHAFVPIGGPCPSGQFLGCPDHRTVGGYDRELRREYGRRAVDDVVSAAEAHREQVKQEFAERHGFSSFEEMAAERSKRAGAR